MSLFPLLSLCALGHCSLVAITLVVPLPRMPLETVLARHLEHQVVDTADIIQQLATTTMQSSDIISALPEKFKNASEQIFFPSVVYEHHDIGLEVKFLQRVSTQILIYYTLCRSSFSCDYALRCRKSQWIGMLRDTSPFSRNQKRTLSLLPMHHIYF